MKVDNYLTEFAAELRLGVDEERTAEIVTEIAAHLESVGGNPIDELGRPSVFARELIAAEAPRTALGRRITIGILGAMALGVGLFGFSLVLYGSELPWRSLGNPLAFGILLGGIAPVIRGRVRDGDGAMPVLLYLGATSVLTVVGFYYMGGINPDAMIRLPAARWVGATLMVVGGVATWMVNRPLRFPSDAPVRSTPFGKVRRV